MKTRKFLRFPETPVRLPNAPSFPSVVAHDVSHGEGVKFDGVHGVAVGDDFVNRLEHALRRGERAIRVVERSLGRSR